MKKKEEAEGGKRNHDLRESTEVQLHSQRVIRWPRHPCKPVKNPQSEFASTAHWFNQYLLPGREGIAPYGFGLQGKNGDTHIRKKPTSVLL